MKVAHLVIEGENIRKIGDILCDAKNELYQKKEKPYIRHTEYTTVIMKECYYLRISSMLMSVITLSFINDNKVEIELVTGGAKAEYFYDFGSENSENRNIVHFIMEICNKNLWTITHVEPKDMKENFSEAAINNFKDKMFNSLKKENK